MKLGQLTFSLPVLFSSAVNVSVDPLPAPTQIRWSSGSPIGLSKELQLEGTSNDIIQNAFERTLQHLNEDISDETYGVDPTVSKLVVQVADINADLQHGVDESYRLDLTRDSLKIKAKTTWGALNGLKTLEQIILGGKDGFIVEAPVQIKDKPLYPYRGLHIDTARNFYSLDALKRQIDGLSYAKMNVFHWHLTDSQAWPLFIKSYPKMTVDAYSAKEVYSIEDVKEIVAYAKARGVRVIPEIDMPGHSAAGWKQIDPELLACLDTNWMETAVEPTPGHLEILNPDVYEHLENIYNDVSELFEDAFFHVGFDELNTGCYKTSERTMSWLEEDPSRTWKDLTQYWVDKTLPIFNNREDRRLIMWQDAVTSVDIPAHEIPKDVILQAWSGGAKSVKTVTSKGYDVIISSSDFFYLDCGFGNWIGDDDNVLVQHDPNPGHASYNYGGTAGSWCGPYKSWQRIYAFDLTEGLTKQEAKHVLGASVALWSEQSDGHIADMMIWPRTAALGELLWSGNKNSRGENRAKELTQRLLAFREFLVQRGISAAPVMPKWCLRNPGKCDGREPSVLPVAH